MNDSLKEPSTNVVPNGYAIKDNATSSAAVVVVRHEDTMKPSLSCERNHDEDTQSISSTNVRHLRPSPVAQAFFAALDIAERQEQELYQEGHNFPVKKGTSQKSQLIQKQIQTLGWRNRYSQHDFYPLTIVTNVTTSTIASTLAIPTQLPSLATTFHVRQIQRGEIDNTYGTGATVWPASVVLIKYLQLHATQLFSKLINGTVLDLGTGTGITSIAAALLGAKHIICTDGDANVVRLAKTNICNAAMEIRNQGNGYDRKGVETNEPTVSIGSNSGVVNRNDFLNMNSASKVDDNDEKSMVHSSITDDRVVCVDTNNKNNESMTTEIDEVVRQKQQTIQRTDNEVIYINNCSIEVQQYWWGTGTLQSQFIHSSDERTTNEIRNKNCSSNIVSNCFDIILVSDCVLPKLYPIEPLIEAINQMLGQRLIEPKPVAIVAYEYRYYDLYDPKDYIFELCAQKQLQVRVIPVTEHDPIYSIPDDIELWHIYRM